MATQVRQKARRVAEPAVIMRPVQAPAAASVCGDCIYHVPHATIPGGWCACKDAKLRWQQVDAGADACEKFGTWPEGSPVPAFIEAMRY